MRNRYKLGNRVFQVGLLEKHPIRVEITEEEETRDLKLDGKIDPGSGRLRVGNRFVPYFVTRTPTGVWVTLDGVTRHFVASKERARAEEGHGGFIAPMPGKILDIRVREDDRVREGQVLVIMEAMKMEHRIEAPSDGRVLSLHCSVGDLVSQGAALLEFSAD